MRNLAPKLPRPGDGAKFTLDDDVALKFFRLQQVSEGTIDLSQGEGDPLKGPTDVGTGREKASRSRSQRWSISSTNASARISPRPISSSSTRSVRPPSVTRRSLKRPRPIRKPISSAFFGRILDDLFIQRMEGNDEIFNRVMEDKAFRKAAQERLAKEVYDRIREQQDVSRG